VVGHPRSVKQFPIETSIDTIAAWRREEQARLQLTSPTKIRGTFPRDVQDYLRARAAMPGIRERTRHMTLWVQAFGPRRSADIQPWEIAAVRDRWLTEGPKTVWRRWVADGIERYGGRWVDLPVPLSASQVNLRLRALENFYTVMFPQEYNPVREVAEVAGPDAEARDLPYAVIDRLLAAMPDRGRPAKGEPRSAVSLTKLRLQAFAGTGFSHRELMGIRPSDLHLDEQPPWVWVRGRQKGKGTSGVAQPLTDRGAAALQALTAAGGLGSFSPSAMWKSLQRVGRRLGLTGIRPYDLRHSFATEVLARTKSLATTQLLMRHKSSRTALRYSQSAVDPVRAAAIEQLRAAGAFPTSPDAAGAIGERATVHPDTSCDNPAPFVSRRSRQPHEQIAKKSKKN
jgi:integrase